MKPQRITSLGAAFLSRLVSPPKPVFTPSWRFPLPAFPGVARVSPADCLFCLFYFRRLRRLHQLFAWCLANLHRAWLCPKYFKQYLPPKYRYNLHALSF